MMKILQLTKHYPPYFGGIESVTYDITEGINRLGYQSDVLCVNENKQDVFEQIKNYQVWRMASWGKLMSTSISPQIIYQLERLKDDYDIIQVHFPDPMNALALFLTRPKSQIIIHWHSDIIKQNKVFRLYKPLQDWVLKRANAVVGTSHAYINSSKQLAPFIKKTVVIPIGIQDHRSGASDVIIKGIHNRFWNKKIVFSLGRLVYYKGFEYLIESARYLGEDTVVLIGGEGRLKKHLQNKIYKMGLVRKVFLLGNIPQDELGSYFEACNVFCLSSTERSEAFGVVLLEAMSFGKPIVATGIPGSGVSWVNEQGVTGFNVPVCSPKDLAGKISLLLDQEGLYKSFCFNSRKRFEDMFTSERMVEQFIDLYKNITSSVELPLKFGS